MIDWTKSMQQTFEYYIVDPRTWGDRTKLSNVKSCEIQFDSDSETLGSASIECDDDLDENYIRAYLVAIQNGITEKYPLGTILVQTPSTKFDGKSKSNDIDAYTPLLELKEKLPPLGYSIRKGENIMAVAYTLCRENMRAPVSSGSSEVTLDFDFVAELDETWLSYLKDFIATAKHRFGLDERGRILFLPDQDVASLRPIATYDDSNSSILYPDISIERDLYGVPNVVEVVYSKDSGYLYSKVVNDDPNSPISTVNRGREVVHRETNPSFSGKPDQKQIDAYAEQMLRTLSCLEYTITYTHGYSHSPLVRVGDCVRLNYERSGIKNIKAKVIKQSIKCIPGCPVAETAVFNKRLWG